MKTKVHISDIGGLIMPEPTLDNPMAQLDFIFDSFRKTKPESSTHGFRYALNYYKNVYLATVHDYSPSLERDKLFYLRERWDSLALVRVHTFLEEFNVEGNPRRIASSTVTGVMSCIRQTMKYAAQHGLIEGEYLHDIALPPPQAETTQNSAYSPEEMDRISEWLHNELKYTDNLLKAEGYQPTGLGQDPRRYYKNSNKKQRKLEREESDNIDNLRWYFENVMQCKAGCKSAVHLGRNYYFYYFSSQYPGGYNQLLIDWKIRPIVNLDIIMPLVLKLSLETGLNPTSLLNLKTDCFQEEHPLSRVPYLKYFKARSQGHMAMHLSIYDKDALICEFKEGQAKVIRRTVEIINQVTAPLRHNLTGNLADLLFIYEKLGNTEITTSQVQSLNDNWTCSQWCCAQVISNNLLADDGTKLQLNLGRFRSTKITDMVRRGVDIFEIQTRMGHKSIKVVFGYIARNHLEIKAQKEIGKALKNITANIQWQQATKPEYASEENKKSENNNVIYKGINADCMNVYDPPEEVKRLKAYDPKQGCTRYNMCLFCKNVILMRHHLPTLITYQRQINQSKDYTLTEFPNNHHYERTLAVLNDILDPKTSLFSKEDLDWARAAAECSDEFIDPVVYRPNL